MLKADFHIHTKEDPEDFREITYTAKDIIRIASKKGFEVLSITNHGSLFFNNALKSYAKKKGILLIPGAEASVSGKEVLLINITKEDLKKTKKFEDLGKLKDSALVMASHPFFGHFYISQCLGTSLEKNIDYFHAIEYCHFYSKLLTYPAFRFLNGNMPAIKLAEKYKKPLVGTSDAHYLYQFDTTYTLVDSPKRADEVIDAVKRNKIKLITKPLKTKFMLKRTAQFFYRSLIPASFSKTLNKP